MPYERERTIHPENVNRPQEWLRIPYEQHEIPILTSKELAWAIGVFCGSGNVDKNCIDFNSVNSVFLEYLHEKLSAIFSLPLSKTKFSERVKNGKLSPHLKIYSAELAGKVRYLAEAHWAIEIEEHYQWIVDQGFIPYFLAGYFDVKGHFVKKKYIRFSTPNIQSAEKLFELLKKIDIYGNIESTNINSFTITIYAFSQVRSLLSCFQEVDLMHKKEEVLLFDEQLNNTADLKRAVNITSFVRFELYQLLLNKKISDVASVKFFDQVGLPVSMRNIRRWKSLESSPYSRHTAHTKLIDIALATDQYLRPKQLKGQEFDDLIQEMIRESSDLLSKGSIAIFLEEYIYSAQRFATALRNLEQNIRTAATFPHDNESDRVRVKRAFTQLKVFQELSDLRQIFLNLKKIEQYVNEFANFVSEKQTRMESLKKAVRNSGRQFWDDVE